MKILKKNSILALITLLMFSITSCFVAVSGDNGKHKGWYKHSKNPNHPNTTNPENTNVKSKK